MTSFELGDGAAASEEGLSGIYLGMLNVFTTLPQFIGTFESMIVFSIFEPGSSLEKTGGAADGPNGISVCLFIGAVCALGAAYSTHRLKQML